jgi:hypothetical protein
MKFHNIIKIKLLWGFLEKVNKHKIWLNQNRTNGEVRSWIDIAKDKI